MTVDLLKNRTVKTGLNAAATVATMAVLVGTMAQADTSWTLGAAANYGIVMGSDAGSTNNNFSTNNGNINGTVGIESGGYFKATGPGTITGIQFQDSVNDSGYTNGNAITSSQNLTGTNNSLSNTSVTNGMLGSVSGMSAVATAINALQTTATNSIAGGTSEFFHP